MSSAALDAQMRGMISEPPVSGRDDTRFVGEHSGLVRSIAGRLRAELSIRCDEDDLMGFGFLGLVEAKQRFDPTRGVQFSTFAYYRIRGAMLDGVRKMARLPRAVHRRRLAAEAMDEMLEAQAESRAEHPEARSDLETLGAFEEILGKITAAHVMAAVGQDESAQPPAADQELIAAERRAEVRDALETLADREKIVLREFYFEDRTLEQIGADLGISKSWTSRLHSRAVRQLREILDGEALEREFSERANRNLK